jgi:hypothetical protein
MAWMKVGTTTLSAPTPTYETDFSSSTGWVTSDSTYINVNTTTEKIDWDLKNDNTDDHITYNLGTALSDTLWVFRCTFRFSTASGTAQFFAGMSSTGGAQNTTQDFIGTCILTGDNQFRSVDSDGATIPVVGDNLASYSWASNTDYFLEIKRTSATAYSCTVRTGSHAGSTVATASGTCTSTTVGLQYILFANRVDSNGGSPDLTIDDMKIYNGVTDTSGASNNLDITGKTVRKFNQFLHHEIPTGGDANIMMTFNNDATQKYARRTSHNGGTDGEAPNESNLDIGWGNADPKFYVHYWIDIAGEEKLGIAFGVNRKSAGAGNATQRVEHVLKYTDTSASITRVDTNNTLGGSYKAGSNISALGTD